MACPYSAPSHYPNQCRIIVTWTITNKLLWNFNQNIKLFIHEKASEYTICEMAAILSRGRWFNAWRLADAYMRRQTRPTHQAHKKWNIKSLHYFMKGIHRWAVNSPAKTDNDERVFMSLRHHIVDCCLLLGRHNRHAFALKKKPQDFVSITNWLQGKR